MSLPRRFPIFVSMFLFGLFLFLLGCSSDEKVTGGTVATGTLELTVEGEDGQPLADVRVYVNDQFKGKTNKYGQGKGTQVVVLEGSKNWIRVEKEGYISSSPTLVSATEGRQRLTVVLETKKTDYIVQVEDSHNTIEGARVSLFEANESSPVRIAVTNKNGEAAFKDVTNGEYKVTVAKEGYELKRLEQEINFSEQGDEEWDTVILKPLPKLIVEVTDEGGIALKAAEVRLYSQEEYNNPGDTYPISVEYTNKDGKAVFTAVDYDVSYVVVAKKEDYLAQVQEKTITPDETMLQLKLVWNIG